MDIEKALNSFDEATRRQALEADAARFAVFNMHCHSFYSYNGYGYSPSKLIHLAKERNWRAVGLVDFDVLDGVDEFLGAAALYNVRACAGMETRVFIPELADVEINSPGEPGIAYHLGVGFRSSRVPESAQTFAAELRRKANARTRQVVELVNGFLPEVRLDFDQVAKAFTPAGNVTERHVCAAYRVKADEVFSSEAERSAYWREKLGDCPADPVKLEALIRSKTMKRGGVGYQKPDPGSFPTLEEMNRFVIACGAKPVVAWLNGLSAGENDPGKLLDLHLEYGAGGITLIPDRNWRASDPEKAAKLTAELDRFMQTAAERALHVLAGTEMNAPGQLLADDFSVPALAKHIPAFIAGADAFARWQK